jgi:hypothetical protein
MPNIIRQANNISIANTGYSVDSNIINLSIMTNERQNTIIINCNN